MAKLIAHGKDRAEALETMRRALDGLVVEGVTSTTPLHQAVLASGEFQSGAYNTGSIPGWTPQEVS